MYHKDNRHILQSGCKRWSPISKLNKTNSSTEQLDDGEGGHGHMGGKSTREPNKPHLKYLCTQRIELFKYAEM